MKIAQNSWIYALGILTLFTTFGAASTFAASKRLPPMELYKYILEAQTKSQEADKKMIARIALIGEITTEFHDRFGRFPQTCDELSQFSPADHLSRMKNPYLEHEYMSRELPKDTSPLIKVEILEDYGISKNSLLNLVKHPPANWDGEPGSIVLMHNTENLFAIRGCGLTRKPVMDSTTGSAYCMFKNLSD